MSQSVRPYLSFEGRAEEAIEFYKRQLGAQVKLLIRNKDVEESRAAPGNENKVLHADVSIGDTTIGISDGFCSGAPKFEGITLALTCADKAKTEKAFAALSDGAQVHQPLTETFFSPAFGMLVDKFGVSWMVTSAPAA